MAPGDKTPFLCPSSTKPPSNCVASTPRWYEQAREQTWLAALTAMMRANDQGGEQEALHALQATKEGAGPDHAWWPRAIMTPERCLRMQEMIMTNPEVFVPKTEWEVIQFNKAEARGRDKGLDEGKAEGKTEAILILLEARGVQVPASSKERILSSRDQNQLKRWLISAASATTVEDLFRT